VKRTAIFPALLLLAGCAQYTPQPLDNQPALLAPPAAEALEEKAGAIERPWLKPVKVDLSKPLTPDAIAALAVVNDPDLAALHARAGIADAQVFAAGLLPDPSISFGLDKVLSGPDTFLQIAGSLGLDLNALRTRAVTRQKAVAEQRQVRLDLAWAEWQAAGDARIEAVRVQELGRQVAQLQAASDAANSILERTARAAEQGDVSASAATAARVAAFDAQDRLRTAEQNLVTARQSFDRLLGLPPDTMLALAEAPLPPAPPAPDALFAAARDRRPDLSALRAGYAAQEAAVHKAILDQFPSLNLSINSSRDTSGNTLLGPSIDFTLPLWNRNRGGIAIERATRSALKAEYDARLFQARSEIAAAVQGIALARRQREQALAGLPELRKQAAASRAAAKRGDLSDATAIAAEQQLRDRLVQIATSEQAIREQTIALELLSGETSEAWTK
jgi:cobalt-zinc-cadmium efflux system outer membrane protein